MAQWGVYRIPVDFALLRQKDDPRCQTENALFRQMLQEFQRPAWCQEVLVVADAAAAYASSDRLALMQSSGYWSVFSRPRTWKFTNRKALNALVTQRPRWGYSQIRLPTAAARHRTFWVYARAVHLSHVGDIMVVLRTY
jgi:hypothetical protein